LDIAKLLPLSANKTYFLFAFKAGLKNSPFSFVGKGECSISLFDYLEPQIGISGKVVDIYDAFEGYVYFKYHAYSNPMAV
jgi:hypothetical protein